MSISTIGERPLNGTALPRSVFCQDRASPAATPRILVVAPEVAALPAGFAPRPRRVVAKAGGLADVTASLVKGLYRRNVEVHLSVPHYRRLFERELTGPLNDGIPEARFAEPDSRLHLAEDRVFYYRPQIYGGPEAGLAAIALQREVLNNVIPRVRPDLIHCHDWMTGLVPAFGRQHGIPCLFTVHNIHSHLFTLGSLEDRGIDAASFWQNLYYQHYPASYEETRECNPCDLLASGICAADAVTVVSNGFLSEIVHGQHDCVSPAVRHALRVRAGEGRAVGITNCPDCSYDPRTDPHLPVNYGAEDFEEGKAANKAAVQRRLGLRIDPDAPLLFWPSRLDPLQKGCRLLTEVLYRTVADYDSIGLQVVAVADGPYQCHVHDIIRRHGMESRVAAVPFEEGLSRCGFAAADFVLMPSLFEPCGLPQMIAPKYGALAIARNTGGLRDTIQPLSSNPNCGNGFLFEDYDANGFRWAIDQALAFFQRPRSERVRELGRIMSQAAEIFREEAMNDRYFALYEEILQRPLGATFTENRKEARPLGREPATGVRST